MKKNIYMREAILLAHKSENSGEIPVGCIIVDKYNKIISRAFNTVKTDKDPTAHAEINAIRFACKELKADRLIDHDMYVTLEPCMMCAVAISRAKIRRLYYGADDLQYGSINGNFNFFQSKNCNHIPEIYDNIDKNECENILNNFFKDKR